jgi:hypothetical protein
MRFCVRKSVDTSRLSKTPINGCNKLSSRCCGTFVTSAVSARPLPGSTAAVWNCWVFSPFRPLPELIGHSGSTGAFAYYCPTQALYLAGTVNQITAQRRAFQLTIQIVNALQ